MTGDARRQRAAMATDAEWPRIGRAADAAGMDRSRYPVRRAPMAERLLRMRQGPYALARHAAISARPAKRRTRALSQPPSLRGTPATAGC